MGKTLAIAALAIIMGLGVTSTAMAGAKDPSAKDPSAGQSSSELNTMSPRSGSPAESGKTGIGSTSGSDAGIDTGLKATSQGKNTPCPEQRTMSSAERDKGEGIVEGTLGEQQRKGTKEDVRADASRSRSS